MLRTRVMPCLLLDGDGLVKGVKFKDYKYVGDPINAVKIFNDKEVDELVLLDIFATRRGLPPNISLIKKVASEAFMPFAYGGGIGNITDAERVFQAGAEKIVLNSAFLNQPSLVGEISKRYGSQSVVVSIDVKRSLFNKFKVHSHAGLKSSYGSAIDSIKLAESLGAGEVILNSVDRDGTLMGYDLELLRSLTRVVNIPVVALGGGNSLNDMASAIKAGASAVAAGSFFVYQGKHRAVLLSYPGGDAIESFQKMVRS